MSMFSYPGGSRGMVPVKSSNLRAVGYHPDLGILTIQFHGGRTYEYYGVPPEVVAELMQAESKGRYLYYYIRGRYSYGRV